MRLKHWVVTALITTVMVLLVVGIANRFPATQRLVGLALNPGGA